MYLAILMPLIWAGNAVLVLTIRYLSLKKRNLLVNLSLAALAKTAILALGAATLISTLRLPQTLMGMMGTLQLFTALIGVVSYLIYSRIQAHNSQKNTYGNP